jgi:hypothetical protein
MKHALKRLDSGGVPVILPCLGVSRSRVLLLALSVLLIGGCGGGGAKLVTVGGTVTRHGKAVPNLGIHFVPEKGPASHGLTDEDGHFTLLYATGQEGASLGTHQVWVQLPPNPQDRAAVQRRAQEPDMREILQKYGNSQTTPLTVKITEDQAELTIKLD